MADPTNLGNLTWGEGIFVSLKTQTATWVVTFLIAILTAFSGRITDAVKSALNRADARTKQQEELATDFSQYIFEADLCTEFIENNWTTKQILTERINDYNAAITTVRKKEYVYLAWVNRYWSKDQITKLEALMSAVRDYDKALHHYNEEIGLVTLGESKQEKLTPEQAKSKLGPLKESLEKLQTSGSAFLKSL